MPIYYNHKNSGRLIASNGEFRSRYADLPSTPLFPFDYGLIYTSFKYGNLNLSGDISKSLEISAEVTNISQREGRELVHLYIQDLVGSHNRPVRELKGFYLYLQLSESRRVTFQLGEESLVFTRADGTQGIEPGEYPVWMGPDSTRGPQSGFQL